MSELKVVALTSAALLGSTVMIGTAAAMPLDGLTGAHRQVAANVQDVRLVCGPRGCWHEPARIGIIITGHTGVIATIIDRCASGPESKGR